VVSSQTTVAGVMPVDGVGPSQIDVAATVFNHFGVPAAPGLPGKPLGQVAPPSSPEGRYFDETSTSPRRSSGSSDATYSAALAISDESWCSRCLSCSRLRTASVMSMIWPMPASS
jgi:hypothetical protein